MPHTLKEGDKVNAFVGWGEHAKTKKGTIILHDKEGGWWSGTPFLVEFDTGGEGWFDHTSLSRVESKRK